MQFFLTHVIDLVYVILAVITVAVFTKRGFIDSAFRFGRTIFAGIICYLVGPHVSAILYEKWVYGGILSWVSEKVAEFLRAAADSVDVEGMIDSLPFFVRQLTDKEQLVEKYKNTAAGMETLAEDFSRTVSQPLASLLSNLVAYVLVFLMAMLLLFVLFKVLDLIFKLPILNAINKCLGFVLGVFSAGLFLAGFTYILGVLVGVLGSASSLKYLIQVSEMFRFFNRLSIFNLF